MLLIVEEKSKVQPVVNGASGTASPVNNESEILNPLLEGLSGLCPVLNKVSRIKTVIERESEITEGYLTS